MKDPKPRPRASRKDLIAAVEAAVQAVGLAVEDFDLQQIAVSLNGEGFRVFVPRRPNDEKA